MKTKSRITISNGSIVRRLHRWLGVGAAAFVLVLSMTGWLLNHTENLNLGKRHVTAAPVLQWYGIEAPRVNAGYRLPGSDWLVQAAGQLFLNEYRISVESGDLIGAVVVKPPGMIAAAFPDMLYLFTPQGELIEKLDGGDDIPRQLRRIGVSSSGTVVVQSVHGRFEADPQVNRWSEFSGGPVRWATSDAPPDELRHRIAREARRHMLTWERLVLDLHSGRLFGRVGVVVFDLVAFLLIVLGATGLYIWLRTPGRTR